MSKTPGGLVFTREHEWVRREADGTMVIGITDHAQQQLGELVYVELPDAGRVLKTGDAMAVVESTKAASDVYAPVGGKVLGVNPALAAQPELVNAQPYGEGWLVKLQPDPAASLAGLLGPEEYQKLTAEAGG
jgi:glycine cleavage system H protein